MKHITDQIKQQLFERKKQSKPRTFRLEFKQQLAAAIIAAFGFLIALAWRDVLVEWVSLFLSKLPAIHPLVAPIASAILVTLIAVVGILAAGRWMRSLQNQAK